MKVSSVPDNGGGTIFYRGSPTGADELELRIRQDRGIEFITNSNTFTISSGNITLGRYHHIAAVMAENNSKLVYIDGNLIASTTDTSSFTYGGRFYLGLDGDTIDDTFGEFLNGTLDEAAIFNRSLSSTEILDHYKRGIVRLNVSVRSCDDSLCSGETFTDITDTSPQNLSLTNNQYFQYNVSLEMDNASYSSEVYNVTVFYSPTDITAPTVTLNTPADNFFNDTASPASVLFNCSATDNSALANISLYITNLTNQSFALNQTANISGTSNSTVWTLSLGNGNYTWNCLAYDSSGNSDWGDANRSMLVNFTAPLPIINYNLTFVMNETTTVAYGYLNGTLNAIFYNNSINALHLNATFNNGTFTSQIFDAGSNKVWNNI